MSIEVFYKGDGLDWCVRLYLQIFGGSVVFMVRIVDAFKAETCRIRKKDLNTWTRERNGVNLILTFTTGMGSRDKKELHKTWLTLCLLIWTNSDFLDVLHK